MQILVPVTIVHRDGARSQTVFRLEPPRAASVSAADLAVVTHDVAQRLLRLTPSVEAVVHEGREIRRGDPPPAVAPAPSSWPLVWKALCQWLRRLIP